MSVINHNERFRPLRGGIVVVAATRQHYGTLGLIATKTGADRWGLTCSHVLGPVGGPLPDKDIVYQPDTSLVVHRIGETDGQAAEFSLDCAAFRIDAGVVCSAEILGIGSLTALGEPHVGDVVIKSGRSTGITEGRIRAVDGDDVEIELRPGFPAPYDLSDPGDSGAIWCDIATRAPLALHRIGSVGGVSVANASRLSSVLAALGLSPLQ